MANGPHPPGRGLSAPASTAPWTNLGTGRIWPRKGTKWAWSIVPFPPTARGATNQFLSHRLHHRPDCGRRAHGLDVRGPFATGAAGHDGGRIRPFKAPHGPGRQVPSWAFPADQGRTSSFSDVSGRDWFDLWVDLSYNLGLMEGPGDGKFWPYRTLTVGEALKLGCAGEPPRGEPSTSSGSSPLVSKTRWTTASKNGIITSSTFDDYARPITRAEMALVFAAAAP